MDQHHFKEVAGRPRRGRRSLAMGETRGLGFLRFSRSASRGEKAPRELNVARPQLRFSYRQESALQLVVFFLPVGIDAIILLTRNLGFPLP